MSRLSTNGWLIRLKTDRFKVICRGMSLRPLFAMLIAFAVLFAPLAVSSGSAMAMAPADHDATMMEGGHCDEQPGNSENGRSDENSCCVAMCTAIAVAPSAPVEPQAIETSIDRPSLVQLDHSFLAELPTPPPRLA